MDEITTIALADGFKLTPTGLAISGNPSFDDWEVVGKQLRYMERVIHWAIGDWLNYGERRWGEMYAQALDTFDYAQSTMATDKYVAGKIETSRRRENLTFSHHREVAPLSSNKQDKILDMAEQGELSTRQVRQLVLATRQSKPNYAPLVNAIIERIDTLAEVYPDGVRQVREYLENTKWD